MKYLFIIFVLFNSITCVADLVDRELIFFEELADLTKEGKYETLYRHYISKSAIPITERDFESRISEKWNFQPIEILYFLYTRGTGTIVLRFNEGNADSESLNQIAVIYTTFENGKKVLANFPFPLSGNLSLEFATLKCVSENFEQAPQGTMSKP